MKELNLHWTSGLTMTCLPLLDWVAQPAIEMTEPGGYGDYTGHMTGDTGGLTLEYRLLFLVGTEQVGTGRIKWDGTKEIPWDAEGIAAAVLAAAEITPIHADTKKINAVAVTGSGTEIEPWGPI